MPKGLNRQQHCCDNLKSCSRIVLEMPVVTDVVKKFLAFCGTQGLFTMFTQELTSGSDSKLGKWSPYLQ